MPKRGTKLTDLKLSLACWDYDRVQGLIDGRVRAGGIDLTFLNMIVEEIFFRMLRGREFDVSEMSMSSYVVSLSRPDRPFIAIRREVYEANRWIAMNLYQAFREAQALCYQGLRETAALKGMLPWFNAHVEDTIAMMGSDFWPYGLDKNRATLDTFLRYHHEQGLSPKQMSVDDMFAPETLEEFVI